MLKLCCRCYAAVDSATPTVTITASPTHGTLSGNWPDLSYEPGADYVGADKIEFKVVQPNIPEFTGVLELTIAAPPRLSLEQTGAIAITGSGAAEIEWSEDLQNWNRLRGWTPANAFHLELRAADRFLRARY